jgi:CRP-like cAMP-binding protein
VTKPLSNLDAGALDALRRLARSVSFAPGAVLMRQGQAARGAFFIETGEVEARVALPGGGELAVARLGPGSVLGEMALLEQGIVSATVIAQTEIRARFMERDDFRVLVAQRDTAIVKLQHAVTLIVAHKLRALNAKLLACHAPEDLTAGEEPGGDPLAGIPRKSAALSGHRRFLPLLAVFREFGAQDIDAVVERAQLLELPRGHWIFVAGQVVGASYIVARGAVEISAHKGLLRRRIAVLGPGEWIGAMSQLDGIVHGLSARARENSVLLEIDRAAFDSLYQACDATAAKIQRAIHKSLLQSLRRTNNHLSRLISQALIRSRRGSVPVKELQSALYGQCAIPVSDAQGAADEFA